MRELPAPLAPMGAYKQFVIYYATPSTTRPGKIDKFPADFRTGRIMVDAHDPQYWTDANTAIAAAANLGAPYGVGFTFTANDPFWFLDIDGCLVNGQWSQIATQLCQYFAGAAIEVSYSGNGLHIFGIGTPPAHGCKNEQFELEFYSSRRFAALTGVGAIGNAGLDFSQHLPQLVAAYFPPGASSGDGAFEWTEAPCVEWRGPTDDNELIRRAMRSQSAAGAFGGRASFSDLWEGNTEALAKAYPDPVRAYDASSADAALAQHLAFWTGKNCERIRTLMEKSKLVRDKWNREDYLVRTITGAASRQIDVLTDKLPEPVAGVEAPQNDAPKPKVLEGNPYVALDRQIDFFAGCVYVLDLHKILVPGGVLLKPEQFKVAFGGHTFPMDGANEKVSRDAFEVFTQSQAFRAPRVNLPAFRPDMPAASIENRGGLAFVNTYWPIEVPRKVGDASPFLNHLRKVLPDERDAMILLSYMAACVQHKGFKFQWAPVIIGTEGNGKTLFTRCVAEAIGRRYVHWPKASQLSNKFNSWMLGRIFYGVEDIFVSDNKADVMEALKPMITGGDGLEIEGKGVDQITADICGNFMFNSNHLDAIRKTANDRRFCMLYTAQMSAADISRDGMNGAYFPELYKWLKSDGYAIVAELLHTWPIPDEFNPATSCHRAPVTTSTNAAIHNSSGGIEQEIIEAIHEGKPGFCGGWISSMMLDRLLTDIGAARRVSRNKRKQMLEAMGYVQHPALQDGRVNSLVLPDGGKPRLFVHENAADYRIATAADAARAYEQANNVSQAAARAFAR